MLKQQTIQTDALGVVTMSPLTLGDLSKLEVTFQEPSPNAGISAMLKFLPFILASMRRVHPDLTEQDLERLTFDDFNALFAAMLQVSGLKKAAPSGEAQAV
jgi:hypothetical protein